LVHSVYVYYNYWMFTSCSSLNTFTLKYPHAASYDAQSCYLADSFSIVFVIRVFFWACLSPLSCNLTDSRYDGQVNYYLVCAVCGFVIYILGPRVSQLRPGGLRVVHTWAPTFQNFSFVVGRSQVQISALENLIEIFMVFLRPSSRDSTLN
jgi:hypothetical protein